MGRVSEGNFAILCKSLPATKDYETRGLGNSIDVGVARLGRVTAFAVQSEIKRASMRSSSRVAS